MWYVDAPKLDHFIEKQVLFASEDVATKNYRLLRIIGSGTFGHVCSAERMTDGVEVAVKTPMEWPNKLFQNEMGTCQALSTPASCDNIVQCLDVVQVVHPSTQVKGMIMELCHIDLRFFWQTEWRKTRMTGNVASVITQQLWNGLAHVHGKGYVHKDIHPRNIMIEAWTGTMKLGDFGLAQKVVPENPAEEVTVKTEVITMARGLSQLLSNSVQQSNGKARLQKCKQALANEPVFLDHPQNVQEILELVFETSPWRKYTLEMRRLGKRWWDEQVAEAPHLQEIAIKAVQWMHTHPETGEVAVPVDVATTFARGFGLLGYDQIDAPGIADDMSSLTTADMKEECRKYFQDFLREKWRQDRA